LLVGFHKVGSGKPSITWPQSVDEALCFGWIDGVRRSLGDASSTICFTPRRSFEQKNPIQLAPEQQRAPSRFVLAQAPWYQRAARWWVISAKRPDTRDARLGTVIVDSEAGRTIAPLTWTKTKGGAGKVKTAVGGAELRAARGRA
jgi:uncharacterized protein YdeI (YjbR/CyaY-like superfamily)